MKAILLNKNIKYIIMITYKDKYLKYKNKYLQLKNNNQKGGGIPLLKNASLINQFTNEHMQQYMNPLHGLILYFTGTLSNIYWLKKHNFLQPQFIEEAFSHKNLIFMAELIQKVCIDNPGIIKPTQTLHKISPKEFGRFIALKYINMINSKNFIILEKGLKINTKIVDIKINETLRQFNYLLFINNDIFTFHLILFCLCWNLINDDGIQQYYEGIYEIFNLLSELQKRKQEKQQAQQEARHKKKAQQDKKTGKGEKEEEEVKEDEGVKEGVKEVVKEVEVGVKEEAPLNQTLLEIEKMNIPELKLEPKENFFEETILDIIQQEFFLLFQRQSQNFCTLPETYPDCGEMTALNLINLFIFNGINFDISKLPVTTIPQVVDFYSKFLNFNLINNDNLKLPIFGKELNARNAWSFIIIHFANSNLNLKHHCDSHSYELKGGLNKNNSRGNFHQLIMNLLGINDLEELVKNNISNLTDNTNSGLGQIIITHKKYGNITIHCNEDHYYIKPLQKNIKSIPPQYTGNSVIQLIINEKPLTLETFFDINISSELLEKVFNKKETKQQLKERLFLLSLTDKFDNDLRRRMIIDTTNERLLNLIEICCQSEPNKKNLNDYTYTYKNFSFVEKLKLNHLNSFKNNIIDSTWIVLLPLENITSIGDYFLFNCKNMEDIYLSPLKNITSVGDDFLSGCNILKRLDLSPLHNVNSIGDNFLSNCFNLNNLDLSPLNKVNSVGNDFLFNCYNLNNLDLSPLNKINSIGNDFLFNCSNLSNLNLFSLTNLTKIGNNVLNDCKNLNNLDLSPLIKLKSIDETFLYGCDKLTNLNLLCLTNLTDIGIRFLFICTSLTTLNLSDLSNITCIKESFLFGCINLTNLNFSNLLRLEYIDHSVLNNCFSLTSLDLSNLTRLKCINRFFLSNCTSLTSLVLSNLSSLTYIGNNFCKNCINLTRLELLNLENLTSLHYNFLHNCSSLTSLDLSNSPQLNFPSGSSDILENCSSLTSLTFLRKHESIINRIYKGPKRIRKIII